MSFLVFEKVHANLGCLYLNLAITVNREGRHYEELERKKTDYCRFDEK